jgi:hypothetical protein
VLSVCTEKKKKSWRISLNGWMRGRMSLITDVKRVLFRLLCWRLDSMDRCFSAVVFFSPKQSRNSPVAPTGFYIHSTCLPYDYHSISTLPVSLFCASGWLSWNILLVTCCFSMQLF